MAFPSSPGSTYPGFPYSPRWFALLPPPGLAAIAGSVATPTDLLLASARRLAACPAEWSRSIPSGPRHTPPDTRLGHARVSPPAPGGPSAQGGTHRNNPRNRLRRSAPGSAGLPSGPRDLAPLVFPTASASHWLSLCRRAVPLSAHSCGCAAIPELASEIPLLPWLRFRSPRWLPRPLPVRPYWPAPSPMPPPAHRSDRSGHTTHKTGTSLPAWPFGPASASAKRLPPAARCLLSAAVVP